MAKDQRFVDLKYEDTKQSIEAVLNTETLPVVVRVVDVGNDREDYNVFSSKLPEDEDIMLHSKLKVKYAHVKVLNYPDNAVKEKQMGPEFVLEHDTYVDVDFLLPAKYCSGFKFIHRPGSWRRYVTVSQLIEELPRYVKVQTETVVAPYDGIGKNRIIPPETQLELVRKVKAPSARTCLEMSDGQTIYSLSETDRINFTEVDDPKVYHFYELLRYTMLPKVFQFQNDVTQDVILLDNQLNSAAMAGVDGPLELIGFVDIEVAVGWIRNKSDKAYTAILIPIGLWKTALVQQRAHFTKEEKREFINKKYGPCKNVDFVEKSLYFTTLDIKDVTWLRSPDFYMRSNSPNAMFQPITTDFGASSDDEIEEEASIYEDIYEKRPSVPARIPLMPLVKRKKTRFHKVHEELFARFHKHKHNRKPDAKPPKIPPKAAAVQRSISEVTSQRQPRVRKPSSMSDSTIAPQRSTSDVTPKGSNNKYLDMTHGRAKMALPSEAKRSNNAHTANSDDEDNLLATDSDDEDSNTYDYPDVSEMELLKLPAIPTAPSEVAESTLTGNKDPHKPPPPNYSKMSMRDVGHILKDNQTEEDFYKYSVMETAHCFRHCGLKDFAEKCYQNTLDGAFFKNFSFNDLNEEPFCLNSFEIKKVEKMILNGWRPKVK